MQYADAPDTSITPSFDEAGKVAGYVNYFIDRIWEQRDYGPFLADFKELCARIWQLDQHKGLAALPESLVLDILNAVAHVEDWQFFEQATSHLGDCPPRWFFKWAADRMATGELHLSDIEKRHVLFVPGNVALMLTDLKLARCCFHSDHPNLQNECGLLLPGSSTAARRLRGPLSMACKACFG